MATTPILVEVQYLGQPIYKRELIQEAKVSRRELRGGMIVEQEIQPAKYREVDTGERHFPQDKSGRLLPKWVDGKYQFRPENNYILAITVDDARRLIARWPHLFKQLTDLDAARTVQVASEDVAAREADLDRRMKALDAKIESVGAINGVLTEENRALSARNAELEAQIAILQAAKPRTRRKKVSKGTVTSETQE
jgi:hypothetical protein